MSQMEQDPWYQAEIIPPNLAQLRRDLLAHFHLAPEAIGIKGNPATHFRGYHRSLNFVIHSPLCTDRFYSATAKVNREGDPNWIAAMDITLDSQRLVEVCRRLDVACRTGGLEKVIEWYGNLGGDNRVDGWDNIANQVATSDPSHLGHLHMSFGRKNANDDHADVLQVLTNRGAIVSPTQAVRIYDPASPRIIETIVPAHSGVDDWIDALYHWYRTPALPDSRLELEHAWRLRAFNDPVRGVGRWDTLSPGRTILHIPRTLGY